ncbi:MAG: hypothetical protein U0638_13670 [Phycisphaerales bacterium]
MKAHQHAASIRSANEPVVLGATFVSFKDRLNRLLESNCRGTDGLRATRAIVALAVGRYADCARAGIPGFNKRIAMVVGGSPTRPNDPAYRLRLIDSDHAEQSDRESLRSWIYVLRALAPHHRSAGLPGRNIVGGGRLGASKRRGEIAVHGTFYSWSRWLQVAEDSVIACGVLHELEHRARHGSGVEPRSDEPPSVVASSKRISPASIAEEGLILPSMPSLSMKTLLSELSRRRCRTTERTIRRWLQEWRSEKVVRRPKRGAMPISHLQEMAAWLEASNCQQRELAGPLREIATEEASGHLSDKRTRPDNQTIITTA